MPVRYIPHPIQAIRIQFPPGRALDPGLGAFVNVYQNLTLRPISLQVSVECTKNVVANFARIVGYTGAGANPVDVAGYAGFFGMAGSAVQMAHFYLEFMVAPGLYYRVAADQGVGNLVQLNIWVEINL
jgi:hypothetical protein